jgi:hypothetical protein
MPDTQSVGRPAHPPRLRALVPREHGAYGQLGLPLCTALAMGRPGTASVALAIAGAAAFVAHEPLLVLGGQRGARARREEGARAARRLALLGGASFVAGGAGLALAPTSARLSGLVPLGLTAVLSLFIARRAEKTAPGELVAAAALSSASLPAALAAGVRPASAWGAWIAFCLVFGASTLAVRTVVAHARAPIAPSRRVVPILAAVLVLVLLGRAGVLTASATLGAAPMLALSLALALTPPAPHALRRVGWALVAASLVLCVALAAGEHLVKAPGAG